MEVKALWAQNLLSCSHLSFCSMKDIVKLFILYEYFKAFSMHMSIFKFYRML